MVYHQRGAHIAFTGTDGVGKTTQAALLHKFMIDQGRICQLAEGKDEFAVAILSTVAKSHGKTPRQYFPPGVFDCAVALDGVRHRSLAIEPLTRVGGIVIESRSTFCRIAVASTHGFEDRSLREIVHFLGRPTITVWLDAPPEVAFERVVKRGTDEESMETLREFRQQLTNLSKHEQWIKIDANKPVPEVFEDVKRLVLAQLTKLGVAI